VTVPVAEEAKEVTRVRPSRHEQYLGHVGHDERFDCVGDHRPIVDRQKMLVRDASEGMKPRSGATREHDALHDALHPSAPVAAARRILGSSRRCPRVRNQEGVALRANVSRGTAM
jgi:hypothetical protein